MIAEPDIASIAVLVGEPARAIILAALMDGKALPASELAYCAGVSPQTASSHLTKLVEGGLLASERHGRHRYYRLTGPEVGQMIEALSILAPPARVQSSSWRRSRRAGAIRAGRTCYDHLAGRLGVGLTQTMLEGGLLKESDRDYLLTAQGERQLEAFGVDVESVRQRRRAFARRCLDWSERRHHLAGGLGAAVAARLFELGWIEQTTPKSRAVVLTMVGRSGLPREFGFSPAMD